jgi:hypothetical protein
MNTTNNQKIKKYDELNVSEKEVIDCFRQMKLISDQACFELFSYKLTDLLNKYEDLLELRKETHALLFDILEEIDKNDLSSIHVDYEKIGRNRQMEADNIAEEVNIVQEYKAGFDEALDMIYSGVAEQLLINEENSW